MFRPDEESVVSQAPGKINADAILIMILILWGATWIYPLIEIVSGASPGKWMLGLRVRRADGRPAGIGRRLLRAVLFIVLPFGMIEGLGIIAVRFTLAMAGLIGVLMVFGTDRRMGHDRISGTVVIRPASPV